MQIHIARNGQQFGPYELAFINTSLCDGKLLPTDLAWSDGMPAWIPLAQIPGVQLSNHAPPALPPVPSSGGQLPPVLPSSMSPPARPPTGTQSAGGGEDLTKLQSKAKTLQIAYMLLFGLSMLVLILQVADWGFSVGSGILWALLLGGAVACRIYRTTIVNRANVLANSLGKAQSV